MTTEEMKAILADETKAFKESLKDFSSKADMTKALDEFKADIEKKFEGQVDQKAFEKLEKAIEKQGEVLAAMKLQSSNPAKTLKEQLIENEAAFKSMIDNGGAGRIEIKTTVKAIQSGAIGSDTLAFRAPGLPGEIHRGVPYLRNLFQVVSLGGNSHGSVKWYEQASITNNADAVAETRGTTSQSAITWIEKTLGGKRLQDWVKIGMDQLKDVDFVLGEIQRLVERNMRLKENEALLSGDGTGNNIKGILAYAKEFVTAGVHIPEANMVDLAGKAITQIDTDLLGAAMPNYVIANRNDTDTIRYQKTKQGAYLFPQWVMGNGINNIGSLQVVENPLVTANTLLIGDFSLATLYVWDDLVIEIAQIEDDKLTGMTTIIAYTRENLRVQDVDKNAFVKVSDLATAITTISTVVG